MKKFAYAIVSALAMAMFISCVQSYTIKTPFRHEDWKLALEVGNCRLEGQAFLKTRGGDVKTCAGEKVFLMPYNDYTAELDIAGKQGGYSEASNLDPNIKNYWKVTTCDADGNFEFDNLPVGQWLLFTEVVWEIPTGRYTSSVQGGDVTKIVQTIENSTQKVYLTGEDRSY